MTKKTEVKLPNTGSDLLDPSYGRLVASDEVGRFYRTLDNNLFMALGNEQRSIVIGSPSPKEGRTFLALMMSFYASQLNENAATLLVDCSRTCDATQALNLDDANGNSLVKTGMGSDLAKSIRPSLVPGLYVCQVFPTNDKHSLLPREKLNLLAVMARKRFSTVIVDSEAAQVSNDYVALTHIFSKILLVTRYRRTRKEQITAQLQALDDADCSILGYVINRRKLVIPNWLYRR